MCFSYVRNENKVVHGAFHTKLMQKVLTTNVNLQCPQKGYTALHAAATFGHSEIVKLLLTAGAADVPDKVYSCTQSCIVTFFELL